MPVFARGHLACCADIVRAGGTLSTSSREQPRTALPGWFGRDSFGPRSLR